MHNLQFHGYIIIPLGQVHKLCGYYYSYANDLIATRLRKTINPPIPMKLAIGHWRRDACHFIDTTTHGSSSIRPANILIIVSTPLTHFAWNVIHDLKSRWSSVHSYLIFPAAKAFPNCIILYLWMAEPGGKWSAPIWISQMERVFLVRVCLIRIPEPESIIMYSDWWNNASVSFHSFIHRSLNRRTSSLSGGLSNAIPIFILLMAHMHRLKRTQAGKPPVTQPSSIHKSWVLVLCDCAK